uniref:Uncharacterized protein n=1 Tax=Neogobius melanostomus TaxID=47308 RepID=A0A8C6UWL0_9GOBI
MYSSRNIYKNLTLGMAGVSCVLSEDKFRCPICWGVFQDPVTTACGHSFCDICINQLWDNCRFYHCPLCKEEFSSRPKLKISIFVLEMVSEFKNKLQKETAASSEPEVAGADVLCDVCPEPKLKALKCCLLCRISYCPDHLTPHNTVPLLKHHQLIAPVENLEERICPEHSQPMELFCRDHSHFMCLQCSCDQNHNTVPLKEQCEEEQSELQQKIQERKEKIQELQRSVELSQESADREVLEGGAFFEDLIKSAQESLDQFKQSIKKKHTTMEKEAQKLMKKIKSEISALQQRQAQMEEICKSDYFHFVQTFTLNKPAPKMKNWTGVSVRVPLYNWKVATDVCDLMKVIFTADIDVLFQNTLIEAKEHAVDVTLDPDTAHPQLVVSTGNKDVCYAGQRQNVPDTPDRFLTLDYVCGKEKFSSGRFYFEVQVKGNYEWSLGVVKESVNRKITDSDETTEENGFWDIYAEDLNDGDLWSTPEKVGVFVDYEEGLTCFFDVDTSRLFYYFTDCHFTGNLLPLFSPGRSAAPLVITPV